MFVFLQRRLAGNSDERCQTVIAEREGSGTPVDKKLPAELPARASNSCEKRTRSSPARKPQLTTVKQDDCCSAVCNSSTPKPSTKCGMTSNPPLGASGHGSPALNRRRSSRSRSFRVTQGDEPTVDSQKLATSVECNGETHDSPDGGSPVLKSGESPLVTSIQAKDRSRSRRSSPRRIASPSNNPVFGGQGVKSIGADSNQLRAGVDDRSLSSPKSGMCFPVGDLQSPSVVGMADNQLPQKVPHTRRLSPRKMASSDIVVKSDPCDSEQAMKSAEAERDPRSASLEGKERLGSASKQLEDVTNKVSLLFGTTQPAKKRIGVQNRRKSSYSDRPEEKQSRGRVRSLEPGLCQKSPRVGRPRRKSETSGIHAAQSQPALEDSGRRLRSVKQSIDSQCQPTPGDKEIKSIEQKQNFDLSATGEELTVKRELGDTDASSVSALDDSNTVTAISDDVRPIQLYLS